MILARVAGTTTITAVVGEVEAARTLTVTPPPLGPLPIVSLSLTPVTQSLNHGASLLFTATPRDFAGRALADRDVTWTSNNDSIAFVSADGTVTGIGVGIAIIEATSNGVRSAASINITPPLDASIVIAVAATRPGDEVGDTGRMLATVHSARPLASVVMTVAGREYPMRLDFAQNAGEPQPVWLVAADLSTIVFGPIALVMNATDDTGRRGTLAVPVIRRPLVQGGNKAPPGSK